MFGVLGICILVIQNLKIKFCLMPNIKKIEQVDQVVKKITEAKSAALIQYQGLNAGDISQLRADIKEVGGSMEVVKNSLITRALAKVGIKLP